jgi:hypothetical protein
MAWISHLGWIGRRPMTFALHAGFSLAMTTLRAGAMKVDDSSTSGGRAPLVALRVLRSPTGEAPRLTQRAPPAVRKLRASPTLNPRSNFLKTPDR